MLLLLKPWGQFCLWPDEKIANNAVKKKKLNSHDFFLYESNHYTTAYLMCF